MDQLFVGIENLIRRRSADRMFERGLDEVILVQHDFALTEVRRSEP